MAARQPNIITRMASRAELVLKRKAPRSTAITAAAAYVAGREPAAVRSWREKVDTLAAWAARCQAEGRMPDLDCEALCKATDVAVLTTPARGGAGTPLPVIHSEETLQGGGLLSPEEDLAECVSPSGGCVHLAGYFALVLNEVRVLLPNGLS
jgi:hypothetical protein